MSASREKKKRQGLTDADVAPSTAGTKKGLSSTGKKVLYSVIAAENGARWKTIESSIRRYLTVAWENNPDYMKLLAGCNLRACPTVAEFIDICSSYMLLHGAEISDEP